jgi:hypothetical protein
MQNSVSKKVCKYVEDVCICNEYSCGAFFLPEVPGEQPHQYMNVMNIHVELYFFPVNSLTPINECYEYAC